MKIFQFLNKKDVVPPTKPPVVNVVPNSYSVSGTTVSDFDAMSVDTVLACVNVLAQSLASLPLELVQKDDRGGSRKAKEHPLYNRVKRRWNAEQTAYEGMYWLVCDSLLRGCGYAQLVKDDQGNVLEIIPLLAMKVKPFREKDGSLWFDYAGYSIPDEEMLRIQVMPHGGIIGKSIPSLAGATLGLAKSEQDSASEFFANGMQSPLVVNAPEGLTDEQYNGLKEQVQQLGGKRTRHKAILLPEGSSASPLNFTAAEAQLLESRKYNRSVIAGLFRVPAHLINDMEKSSFTNVENASLDYVKFTLTPWLSNIEQRLCISLLKEEEWDTYQFKFNLEHLVRGDLPTRATAYATFVNCGIMTRNEVRALEDMPMIEGGDVAMVQGAMIPAPVSVVTSAVA